MQWGLGRLSKASAHAGGFLVINFILGWGSAPYAIADSDGCEAALSNAAWEKLLAPREQVRRALQSPHLSPDLAATAEALAWLDSQPTKFFNKLAAGLRQGRYHAEARCLSHARQALLEDVQAFATSTAPPEWLQKIAEALDPIPSPPLFSEHFPTFRIEAREKILEQIHALLANDFSVHRSVLIRFAAEKWEGEPRLLSRSKPHLRILQDKVARTYQPEDFEPMLVKYATLLLEKVEVSVHRQLQFLSVDPLDVVHQPLNDLSHWGSADSQLRSLLLENLLRSALFAANTFSGPELKKQTVGRMHRQISTILGQLPQAPPVAAGPAIPSVVPNRESTTSVANSTANPRTYLRGRRRRRNLAQAEATRDSSTTENSTHQTVAIQPLPDDALLALQQFRRQFGQSLEIRGVVAKRYLTRILGSSRNNRASHYVFRSAYSQRGIYVLVMHRPNSNLDRTQARSFQELIAAIEKAHGINR
jgi:hypothetical protein